MVNLTGENFWICGRNMAWESRIYFVWIAIQKTGITFEFMWKKYDLEIYYLFI